MDYDLADLGMRVVFDMRHVDCVLSRFHNLNAVFWLAVTAF